MDKDTAELRDRVVTRMKKDPENLLTVIHQEAKTDLESYARLIDELYYYIVARGENTLPNCPIMLYVVQDWSSQAGRTPEDALDLLQNLGTKPRKRVV